MSDAQWDVTVYFGAPVNPNADVIYDTFLDFEYESDYVMLGVKWLRHPTLETSFRFSMQGNLSGNDSLDFGFPNGQMDKTPNYVEFWNGDVHVYYFVTGVTRLSNRTVELKLRMDTLTTFFSLREDATEKRELWKHISGRSQIHRRHKDRWYPKRAVRIDRVAEGINPPLFFHTHEPSDPGMKNREQAGWDSPFITGSYGGWKIVYFTPSSALTEDVANHYPQVYFLPWGGDITIDDTTIGRYEALDITDSRIYKIVDCPFFPDGGSIPDTIGGDYELSNDLPAYSPQTVVKLPLKNAIRVKTPRSMSIGGGTYDCIVNNPNAFNDGTGKTSNVNQVLSDMWVRSHLINLSPSSYEPFNLDPKATYGEFGEVRVQFDSQSITFNLADLEWEHPTTETPTPQITEQMFITRDFSSNWFWRIDVGGGIRMMRKASPYANILQSGRANEESVISSEYLDYMRNGYNYDVKQKDIQSAENVTGIVLSAVSLIGGLIMTAIPGMQLVGGAAVLGGITGLVGKATGNIYSDMSSQNSIDRKRAESMAKGATVSGLKSQDLLREYQGSLMPMVSFYECSEEMKRMANALFYYYGYKDDLPLGYYGTFESFRTNELMSRFYFNFIEMDIVWSPSAGAYADQDVLDDIQQRFARGVTIFHQRKTKGHGLMSDYTQTKSNSEMSLLDDEWQEDN